MNAPRAATSSLAVPRHAAGWAAAGLVLLAVVASFAFLALDLSGLFSARSMRAMGRFIGEFLSPDLSRGFVQQAAWAALQTFAVSAVGSLLAMLGGIVLALPASGRLGGAGLHTARLLLNVLRSVPELVWAALMVLAAGLGPFAGVLALALHTTGVLGRLFAETLENAPAEAELALRQAGSGRLAAFCYGTLPQVVAQWTAYTLYRWEMNIRMAAVLGFVGAGGLGQMLYYHLSLFQQAQAATVVLAMFVLVFVVDGASTWLRRGLTPVHG